MATPEQLKAFKTATRGQKKKFNSSGDDRKRRVTDALQNAAQRRAGLQGAISSGGRGGTGRVSGGGTSSAASFAANSKGRFTPRTPTGRPVGDGAGPPDRIMGGPGSKNGQPLRKGFSFGKKS